MLKNRTMQDQWEFNYIKLFFISVVILLYCDNAFSATELEFINERTIKGKKYTYTVTGLFEGKKARYTFQTEDGAGFVSGTYLLSNDGGKTTYFITDNEDIDEDEKICHQWTNREFVQILGKYLLKTTKSFNVKITNPSVTKVFEKETDDVNGLPAKHIRLNAKFTASYKFLLFDNILNVERQIDSWVVPKIEGVETKPILQRSWQISGYNQFDKVLKDTAESIKGYRVRNVIAQTITDKKGKKSVTKIVQHIKSIKKTDKLSEDVFKIPSCTKISSYDMEVRAKHFISLLAGDPL